MDVQWDGCPVELRADNAHTYTCTYTHIHIHAYTHKHTHTHIDTLIGGWPEWLHVSTLKWLYLDKDNKDR